MAYSRVFGMSQKDVFICVSIFGLFNALSGLLIGFGIYAAVGSYCASLLNETYLIQLNIWQSDPAIWKIPYATFLVCCGIYIAMGYVAYNASPQTC